MIENNQPNRSDNNFGIPVISAETIETLESRYLDQTAEEQTWGERLEETRDRLVHKNPHMARFIEMQVSKYDRELHRPLYEVIIGTLALIEEQNEADASGYISGVEFDD